MNANNLAEVDADQSCSCTVTLPVLAVPSLDFCTCSATAPGLPPPGGSAQYTSNIVGDVRQAAII